MSRKAAVRLSKNGESVTFRANIASMVFHWNSALWDISGGWSLFSPRRLAVSWNMLPIASTSFCSFWILSDGRQYSDVEHPSLAS